MTYKTCVTIAEKNPKELLQVLKTALKKSDYAEIRFDFLKPSQIPEVLELVKKKMKRCVCTLRPTSEGGKFSGKEGERISTIKLIAEYNPYLLDVEFNTLRKNKKLKNYIKNTNTNILVSWHDFKKTPNSIVLKKLLINMKKFSKFIKIVTTSRSNNDASRIFNIIFKFFIFS